MDDKERSVTCLSGLNLQERRNVCKFYYDCQTILQNMTIGSSILIRFRGVHSHRSHSDTVAVLSSSVHLAQESRVNHKSTSRFSKDTWRICGTPCAGRRHEYESCRWEHDSPQQISHTPPVDFVDKVNSYGQKERR